MAVANALEEVPQAALQGMEGRRRVRSVPRRAAS